MPNMLERITRPLTFIKNYISFTFNYLENRYRHLLVDKKMNKSFVAESVPIKNGLKNTIYYI